MQIAPMSVTLLIVFQATAVAQAPLWQTSGPAVGAQYGFDVERAGDWNGDGIGDVVVGAPGAGTVQVLSGEDGSLLMDVLGPAPTWSRFGLTVSSGDDVDGDGTLDLAIGAPWINSAYVCSGATGTPIYQAGEFVCSLSFIGREVQMLGDVTGDGVPDVAVSDGGQVDTVLPGSFTLRNENPAMPGTSEVIFSLGDCPCVCDDLTGYTVSRAGDFNGDGLPDFALSERSTGLQIFGGPNATLLFQASLTVPDTELVVPYTDLGCAPPHVAGVGDVNQDGFDDVAAVELIAPGAFSAHVYLGPNGALAYSIPTNADRVVGIGDVNQDGRDDFLLGAPLDDTAGMDAGAVFLHSGLDGSLIRTFYGQIAGGGFGAGLAAIGDASGDGLPDVAISAPYAGGGHVAAFASVGDGPVPLTYCTAKLSSAGCLPGIDSSGTPTVSGPDDFLVLTRDALVGKPGLFFWGTTGSIAAPFLGGVLCVQPGLTRTAVQAALGAQDCDAGYAFQLLAELHGCGGLSAGDTVNGQFWTRDPAQPDGTGAGLTDAIEFKIWL